MNYMKYAAVIITFFISVSLSTQCFAIGDVSKELKPALDTLTSILADDSLKGDENKKVRREKIMEAIKLKFDFREMSKRILGKTWNNISAEERDYFTVIMTKFLENIYIGRLETYSGQEIVFAGEQIDEKKKIAKVKTTVEYNGSDLPIFYFLKKKESWMVYDINIEGLRLVNNYRKQFGSILRKEKFDGLVKVIEKKNKSFETKE